jgi:hypothetical protein
MAKIQTRQKFKEYCLRRLGWPVVDINIDDDQVEDRINDALEFFNLYHYNGTEKLFMKHQITQEDINRKWIYCPDTILFVIGVFPFTGANSSNMFDIRYQMRLNDLYNLHNFTSVSYVHYEITMQHLRTLNLIFTGTPQFRFNSMQNRLFLDIDWDRDVQVGSYVIMECYRKINPDLITLTGTVTTNTESKIITGTNTIFDQEILENDVIHINDIPNQVDKVISPTELTVIDYPQVTSNNVTLTIVGLSDVWNDKFMKAYATAKIKYQWATNIKKYSGIQLPGGITLNGKEMYDEAVAEIDHLEESIHVTSILPSDWLIG